MVYAGKFGVPIDPNQRQGFENSDVLMPKQKWKFRALFTGFGMSPEQNDLSQNIMNFSRPGVSFSPTEIHSFASIAYIPSKHVWNSVTCTLRDDINNTVLKLIGEQISKQIDLQNQTAPRSAHEAKFLVELAQTTGAGDSIEVMALMGTFIESYESDQNDYSASDPMTHSITLRPDNVFIGDGGLEGNTETLLNANFTPGFRAAVYANG